ncbi:hypothetical protein [Chitinophaga pinensis]|uniref:hypothetical protein n=1 Tax=Chitinophaga pinensis TaxID=79329 RepID=UPI001645CA0C|nr:hypothetical protein [Chitinophaga pinensis]
MRKTIPVLLSAVLATGIQTAHAQKKPAADTLTKHYQTLLKVVILTAPDWSRKCTPS